MSETGTQEMILDELSDNRRRGILLDEAAGENGA